jgi:cell division inhibitor SepF
MIHQIRKDHVMSGAMRKMGVYLGLVEDDPYGEYGDPVAAADERYAEPATSRRYSDRAYAEAPATYDDGYGDRLPARAPRAAADPRTEVHDLHDVHHDGVDDTYRITTLHPRTYNEARTIGEHFRAGTPVIMNLTDMDDADAKRLVDFSAGLTFGLHGRIERVTAKVFLLSPQNVSVTAEDKARIVESGFFNQS